MKFKLYISVIIVLVASYTISAVANNIDSIENQIEKYVSTNGSKHIDLANSLMKVFYDAKIVDDIVKFDASNPRDSINQQVWYWASEYFYAHQAYPQALKYGLQALPLCNNDIDKANYLSLISLIYFRQSNYEQAANYAKQCYKLDEKSGDPDIMSSSLNTLAGIYIGANQPKEAEQYILKGIALAKQAKNSARMAVLLGMASEAYHAQGNDEEALKYIEEACKIEQELGNEYKLMVRLSQKASVLIGLHDYACAEILLSKAIPFFE